MSICLLLASYFFTEKDCWLLLTYTLTVVSERLTLNKTQFSRMLDPAHAQKRLPSRHHGRPVAGVCEPCEGSDFRHVWCFIRQRRGRRSADWRLGGGRQKVFFFFCIKYITYCLQNKTFRLNSVEQRLSYKSLCTSCTSALCRVYNVKEYTPYLVHCMTK